MSRILDPKFKYKPSFDTDVRRTFERLRREQQKRADRLEEIRLEVEAKVEKLPKRRTA